MNPIDRIAPKEVEEGNCCEFYILRDACIYMVFRVGWSIGTKVSEGCVVGSILWAAFFCFSAGGGRLEES